MKKFIIIFLFLLSFLEANQRIVSLSPSITEILFALGKGDEVVATTTYSLYPKEAQKLPVIGSYISVDIEKIISLKPTLVVAQQFLQKDTKNLQKLSIDVLHVKLDTIEHIENSIMLLGKRLGTFTEAKKLVALIEKAKKEVKHSQKQKRVLVVFGLHEKIQSGIYVSGNHLFYDEILKICGDRNAFEDESISQPVLNYEHIVALNPDAIIILHSPKSNPHVNRQKALKAWKALPVNATKNDAIYIIEDDYISIPSHRIALSIKRICGVL